MALGILASHPIQYHAPWFRGLAKEVDLEVFFAHRQSAAEQGKAGFGVAFEWDVDLLSGYRHQFLKNVSSRPNVTYFTGCDTPEISEIISGKQKPGNPKSKIPDSNFSISAFQHLSVSPFDAFIVTGWYLKSYLQAVDACRVAGVPVLVRGDSQLRTPRSLLKRLAMEVRQRWLLRKFDGFLTVGQRNREYLEHYGVPARKIFSAPHFVDNEWFAARAAQARNPLRLDRGEGQGEVSRPSAISHLPSSIFHLRKSWGADEATLVVLFVGKFQPIKRPHDILKALAILHSQSAIPSPTAVFVGSGELDQELRQFASRANLRVHFAGFKNQSELPLYYAAADVLVLPSESETWGLVVNEAMACGLPAIVSDAVGCAPDLIEEGQTGFVYPVGDVEALARRLQQFVKPRAAGSDFRSALEEKMRVYSLCTAVKGTLRAVTTLAGTRLFEPASH